MFLLIIISDDSLLLPQSAYVPVGGAECGFKGHKGAVTSVGFSLDGKLLATSGEDGTVKLWRVEGLDELMVRGCAWIRDYLNNPDSELMPEERHVCDGIGTASNLPKK